MPNEKIDEMVNALGDMLVLAWDVWEDARSEHDVYTKICMTNLVHNINGAINALAQLKELKEMEEEECSRMN